MYSEHSHGSPEQEAAAPASLSALQCFPHELQPPSFFFTLVTLNKERQDFLIFFSSQLLLLIKKPSRKLAVSGSFP